MNNNIIIKLSEDEHLNIKNVYKEIVKKIFDFEKTCGSFKDNNNILHFRNLSEKELLWKKAIYNVETSLIEESKGEIIDFDFILENYFKDIF